MDMMMRNNIFLVFLVLILQSCALAPGMNLDTESSGREDVIFLDEGRKNKILVEDLTFDLSNQLAGTNKNYRLGVGDKVNVTVWGLPDIFPISGVTSDINSRTVANDGNFYFPYAGYVEAEGKTVVEVRENLTSMLSKYFTDPQLDVNVTGFSSQRIYVLGEVARPQKISLNETPLSLADALGLVNGLNNNTSNSSEVYVIRQGSINQQPRIFRADFSTPATFLIASEFYLVSKDIIYVNASGTAKWNRVISQFFPFSSFLNSVDNLVQN